MSKVKLGLLGSGTVGTALQDFIFEKNLDLEIAKIYTRDPGGKKWHPKHPELFTTKPEEVLDHPEIDILVEALGATEEKDLAQFSDYIIRAFKNGKAVVTSDKAVLARFGKEIWAAAERYGQELRFEACVGGGIPIIRSLTESFAAEEPEALYGIVNGTCNYVLSSMAREGKSYEAALREAQERGYAETDPKADTSGFDAEAKLILLIAVAFGCHIEPGRIWRKGIEEIHALDFLYASQKGRCTIKPLASARSRGSRIEAFVAPALVPYDHFLSAIEGPTNAIFFKGKRSAEEDQGRKKDWDYVFAGPGAGGGPTAVAILGDVLDLARGRAKRGPRPPSLLPPGSVELQPQDDMSFSFYSRFVVRDQAGIVGDICQAFGKMGIHISEVWQLSHSSEELGALARSYGLRQKPDQILPFVITLERAGLGQIKKVLEIIRGKDYILVDPVWLPIWRN